MAARKPLVQLQASLGEMPAGDAVGVAQGGTGATTAPAALSSLGAYPATNPSGYIASSQAPVQSVAGRTGTITLGVADVSGAYASSNPAGYITASGAPVQSVAGRAGAVTLGVADVSGALSSTTAAATYAPLNNPSFTGNSFAFGYTSTAGSLGTEYGSSTTAQFTYWDWHSSGTGSDFDVRMSSSGGSSTAGTGDYSITSGTFKWNGNTVLTTGAAVTVGQGGTGATTATQALVNLGGVAASGGAANGLTQDFLSFGLGGGSGNLGGSATVPGSLGSIGWNYSNGNGETDFFNCYTGAAAGTPAFAWHQKLTANTTRMLMSLNNAGTPSFAQPVPIGSGGTGATTPAGALSGLGAYPASNPSGFITSGQAPVQSVAGRAGAVTLGVADVSGALGTATAAATYAPLYNPSFTGSIFNYGLNSTTPTCSEEIGSLTTPQTTYRDWHSSGYNNDYDVREAVSGGVSGTAGQGNYSITAKSYTMYGCGPVIVVAADFVSTRIVSGNYGVVEYCDGTDYYLLVTNSGQQYTTNYSGLRPFHLNLASGLVSMDNGIAPSDINMAGSGGMAGAWNSYQATVSASTGAITTAAATVRYKKLGRTVFFNLYATITNNGSGAGTLSVSLPFANNGSSPLMLLTRDLNSLNILSGYIGTSAAAITINRVSDNAYPVAANGAAGFTFSGVYEASA